MSETTFSYDHDIPLPEGPAEPMPMPTFEQGQARPVYGRPIFFHQARKRVQPNGETAYENIECVKILTPGDPKAVAEKKVTDGVRRRYHVEYAAWKQGLQVSQRGTPLEAFPTLTPALIMQLKAENIFTVEDLANLPDANLHRIHMGQTLKRNAKLWLDSKKDTDAIERQVRENEAMKDQINLLEQQIREIATRAPVPAAPVAAAEVLAPSAEQATQNTVFSDALSAAVDNTAEKRKPGRPRKEG